MRYIDPNQPGSKVQFKSQYENFIGGEWVPPVKGVYFENSSPVDGKVLQLLHAQLLKMSSLR
jgi:aldehyde dehydrogenase